MPPVTCCCRPPTALSHALPPPYSPHLFTAGPAAARQQQLLLPPFPALPRLPGRGGGSLLGFPGAVLLTGLGVVGWTIKVGFKVSL